MIKLFALLFVSRFRFHYNTNLSKLIISIPSEIIVCGFLIISGGVEGN